MSHCLFNEQQILLFKFLLVSLIFFQISKKKKKKKNEIKKCSEVKNFITQSMSVSDNVSVRKCQDLVNVRVR